MTVGEVKNSKFNFQLNIITTLIFGNQFCPYKELLWLHFIVIIMFIITNIIIIIIIIIIVVDKIQGITPIPVFQLAIDNPKEKWPTEDQKIDVNNTLDL